MKKLGIWGIAIAAAFVVGILSANPVVDAAGGWQLAFQGLQDQIDSISGNLPQEDIMRFRSSSSTITMGLSGIEGGKIIGIDGTITKFIYRMESFSIIPPTDVTVTIFKNTQPTALTCVVQTILNTVVTCTVDGSVPVQATDLIIVADKQDIFNQISAVRHAAVFVTPNP